MIPTATQENRTLTKANADALSSASYQQQAYTERPIYEADVLMQLKSNLAQLEDLHERLRFMMAEIAYLMKKS